jgi:hypothetical protein
MVERRIYTFLTNNAYARVKCVKIEKILLELACGLCEYCRSQAKYAIALKCSNFLDSQVITLSLILRIKVYLVLFSKVQKFHTKLDLSFIELTYGSH